MILWGALAVSSLYAQRQRPKNQPYADMKRYHFGFHVGMHTQDLILTHSGVTTSDGKMWFAEIPSYSPEFNGHLLGGQSENLPSAVFPCQKATSAICLILLHRDSEIGTNVLALTTADALLLLRRLRLQAIAEA